MGDKVGTIKMNKRKYAFRVFFIKLFSWEYWPMWVVYFPVSFYYLYLSVKARSLFFFSASNPTIETGGMFFESKWKIFELMPKEYFPKTILVHEQQSPDAIVQNMADAGIPFPIVAKPDRGERGWAVQIIHNQSQLTLYRKQVQVPFLIQSYISYPLEFSIFYYRHPLQQSGAITSVTMKKLLTITGNGISTVGQLIASDNRSLLQMKTLANREKIYMDKVLPMGEEMVLVPYGNHVRGAMFLNYNHIVDSQLTQTFDSISNQINGFYFGRFDIRCTSIEELKQGKNISILELNGAGAEPAHIYHPGFSFWEAQRVLASHYKMMYQAAIENKKRGVPFMSYVEYKDMKRQEKTYKSKITLS